MPWTGRGAALVAVLTSWGAAHADAVMPSLQSVIRARGAGKVPVGTTYSGFLRDGSPRTLFVTLDAHRCYLAAVAGAAKLERLVVSAHLPSGAVLAQSTETNKQIALPFCATDRGKYGLELAATGDGDFAMQLLGDPLPTAAPQVASAPSTPAAPTLSVREQTLEELVQARAPSATRVGAFLAGEGPEGTRLDFRIPLDAGRCYLFASVGSVGVIEQSIYLWDPSEERMGEVKGEAHPVYEHCAKVTGSYHLQAKLIHGGGSVSVGVYAR